MVIIIKLWGWRVKKRLYVVVGAASLLLATPVLAQSGADVPTVELSGTGLAALVAAVVSVVLASVPGAQAWWAQFAYKREALAGAGLVLTGALVALHYAGALDLGLGAFGWPVVWQAVEAWLAFAGAGQLAFTGQKFIEQQLGR